MKAQLCKCGCGKCVRPKRQYLRGHNKRGCKDVWTEERRQQNRIMLQELHRKGIIAPPPWTEERRLHQSKVTTEQWRKRKALGPVVISLETRAKMRKSRIRNMKLQAFNDEPFKPAVGFKERDCLNYLESLVDFKIVRQFAFYGYFLDGFVPQLQLAVEFDEKVHFTKALQKKDRDRQREIEEGLHCTFFRIKYSDWDESPKNVGQEFLKCVGKWMVA